MKKRIQWLLAEVDLWVREGIIDSVQARRIQERYPTAEHAASWSRIAFGVTGGVLIGLGVILLFAYNWDRMHKFAKLAIIFAALISAHGAALFVRRPAASETLHILGTMMFGAGIWLVAQVYHIEEHYPNAFLAWGIGALALAWTLPSVPQALMAASLLVLWNGFEVFQFRNPNHIAPLLIFFGILPLAWRLRSRLLWGAGMVAFLLALFFTIQRTDYRIMMPLFFSCSAALIAGGMLLQRGLRFPGAAPVSLLIGNILYFFILYLLTFPDMRSMFPAAFKDATQIAWFSAPAIFAVGLWIAAFRPLTALRARIEAGLRLDYLAVPAALLLVILQTFKPFPVANIAAVTLYNLLFLFSAVTLMLRGFRSLHLRSAVMGWLLLAALAAARYADLFHSLLARAVVFLLVGAAMLGMGIFFSRAKRARQEERQ